MKLHLSQPQGLNAITAYQAGSVSINQQRYHNSVIVTPQQLISDWPVAALAQLDATHIAQILALQAEIVLIGCGEQHQFISPKLTAPLTQAQIAVESMTTAAACRTYNILLSEGRKVLAALIV